MPTTNILGAVLLGVSLLACVCLHGGCSALQPAAGITAESLLHAAKPSPDAVTLDLYWVRLPHSADGRDGGLWKHVDEDRLPVALRRRLAGNGLRAGVIGRTPPDVLLRLLDPDGEADLNQGGVTALKRTGVSVRTRQLRPGQELPVNASPILAEATVAIREAGAGGGPGGGPTEKSFAGVQGVYILETARADDDRAWVSLLPTLQHGAPRMSFSQDETGVVSHGAMTRSTEAFPDMAISADLAPGEMLIVTNLPGSASQLGGLFHAPADGTGCQRKAIVVRVARAPASTAFLNDADGLPPEGVGPAGGR